MKYIVFLRAINVGGHNSIKMTDLKQIFEALALENVQTYIQSGNVIFESEEKDASALEKRIETALKKASGSAIQVFARTMRQARSIAENSPFTAQASETVHVVFLKKKPDRKQQQAVLALKSEADDFAVRGREVYNLRRDREKSVFSNNFVEKTLNLSGTTRNLPVIKKIVEKYR